MKKSLAVCLLLILLAGCGVQEAEESTAVCFVLGAHSNFPVVNVSRFYTDVYDACCSYGSVSAVAANYDITPPSTRVDADKRRQLAEGSKVTVLKALQSVSAGTPEVDTLGALALGRDLLVNKDAARKRLVIVDSMLSTASLLDFSDAGLIEQTPDAIVAQLEQRHAIPDLTGKRPSQPWPPLEMLLNGCLRPLRFVDFPLSAVQLPDVTPLQFVVDRRRMHDQPRGDFKRVIPAGVPLFDFLSIFKRQVFVPSCHAFIPLFDIFAFHGIKNKCGRTLLPRFGGFVFFRI